MSGKNQWVVRVDDHWGVRAEGAGYLSGEYRTQQQAIDHAKLMAQMNQSELFIQNRHGQIRERNTYGPNDPFPPRG